MAKLISQLFQRKETTVEQETIEDQHREPNIKHEFGRKRADDYPRQISVGWAQSVGKQRDHNEDALYFNTSEVANGQGNTSLGLFILADGMGGHRNGEVASDLTCRVIAVNLLGNLQNNLLSNLRRPTVDEITVFMNIAIEKAQEAVLRYAPGGGTTVVIAILIEDQLIVSNVGDSRVYLVSSDGKLEQITRDHSLVQRLVELNEITPPEAKVHPQRNVLLRAIGQPDPFQADTQALQIPEASRVLLCSDGLWGVVSEQAIRHILMREGDPAEACRKLVAAANNNGGPDNISVILAGYR